MNPIEDLALRLHLGARAIKEGRVEATVAELVEGAMRSVHAEMAVVRGGGRLREIRSKRAAAGLCTNCGRMEAAPGHRWCAMCILRLVVARARRRGEIPHIRH